MICWRIEKLFRFVDGVMSNETLRQLVDSMSPDTALDRMAVEIRRLFSHMREDARIDFLVSLMGGSPEDKDSSLVHL
jgi:hypothetical protein